MQVARVLRHGNELVGAPIGAEAVGCIEHDMDLLRIFVGGMYDATGPVTLVLKAAHDMVKPSKAHLCQCTFLGAATAKR